MPRQRGRPGLMATDVSVREGDLARVWNGKRWCDGRIRRVLYDYAQEVRTSALAVEIRFEGCGCDARVQRGQCKHVFHMSDCGRLWVRDCPLQRKHRRVTSHHHHQVGTADGNAHSSSSSSSTRGEQEQESARRAWPTAKFHRVLPVAHHKKRKETNESDDARPLELPKRNDADGVAAGGAPTGRKKTFGRRMPAWCWPAEGLCCAVGGGDGCSPAMSEEAVRQAEERHRWRLERAQDWKRWQASQQEHSLRRRAEERTLSDQDGDEEFLHLDSPRHAHGNDQRLQQSRARQSSKKTPSMKMRKKDTRHDDTGMSDQPDGCDSTTDEKRATSDDSECEMKNKKKQVVNGRLELDYGEWVRMQSVNGVVWIEEGPQVVVLKAGDQIVSGPNRRLDLPEPSCSVYLTCKFFEECSVLTV